MRNQKGWGELIVFIFVALLLGSIAMVLDCFSCSSRWSGSGLGTSWGPIQGCVVIFPDGRRIPADNVRDIEIPKVTK